MFCFSMTHIREKNYNFYGLLLGVELVVRNEIEGQKVKEKLL